MSADKTSKCQYFFFVVANSFIRKRLQSNLLNENIIYWDVSFLKTLLSLVPAVEYQYIGEEFNHIKPWDAEILQESQPIPKSSRTSSTNSTDLRSTMACWCEEKAQVCVHLPFQLWKWSCGNSAVRFCLVFSCFPWAPHWWEGTEDPQIPGGPQSSFFAMV